MNPTNITPAQDPASLQNTSTEVKTAPAAVITSDLATNITNNNLNTLAQEEQSIKNRLEQDRLLKIQKDQEFAKQQAKSPSAADKKIAETLGTNLAPTRDFVQEETDKRINNMKATIQNISKQVDPITAKILDNIQNLVLTQD